LVLFFRSSVRHSLPPFDFSAYPLATLPVYTADPAPGLRRKCRVGFFCLIPDLPPSLPEILMEIFFSPISPPLRTTVFGNDCCWLLKGRMSAIGIPCFLLLPTLPPGGILRTPPHNTLRYFPFPLETCVPVFLPFLLTLFSPLYEEWTGLFDFFL